jgi:uncharacterized protein (TIGR02594 family)
MQMIIWLKNLWAQIKYWFNQNTTPKPLAPPVPIRPVPPSVPSDNTPWLAKALSYLGEAEVPGNKDNQFILDCFKHTTYPATHDEVPWCAAFVCRVLEESGYKSTKSAAAISYADYGTPCELKPGAIVVFRWASGGHHVSICNTAGALSVNCCGGNQSDQVRYSDYAKIFIVATRWPVK